MKILIIDDEEVSLEYVKNILEEGGYETVLSHNAMEAVAKMSKQKPEMIISDIAMPYLSPFKLLNDVKNEKEKPIPFAIMSALEEKEIIETAYNLGADAYFVKPVDPEKLLQFVSHFYKGKDKQEFLN